jgi:hypothetical protein
MTAITINLARGPEGQPVGHLHTATGQTIAFTGWLDLIRVLEDELRTVGEAAPDDDPSSQD